MNNTTKLTMLTILTAGILMSSFMLANSNPTFAKKKQCDNPDTICQTTTNDVKTTKSLGQKGKDGASNIASDGTSNKGKDGTSGTSGTSAKGKDGTSGTSAKGKDGTSGTSAKGKDGTPGTSVTKDISVSSKHGNNDSNVVEEQTQLDNSSASASASASGAAPTSPTDNSGSASPFDLPM